jgi:DNA-binding transcriptional MocR family regulator
VDKKLSIYLDNSIDTPLYLQLFIQLKNLIKEGVFQPNEKLPPIRKLAQQLKINTITVVNAYRRLESQGLAYSIIGSGTYVASSSRQEKASQQTQKETNDLKMMEKGQIQIKPDTINFASTTPTPDLFPVDSFKMLINKVLERDKGEAFGYQQVQGYQPLRQSICKYLENFSINVVVDNIQVISGAQQGIDIVSKALIEYGDCVFVESPTYRGALEAFKSRGARIVEIPIQQDGIDIDALKQKLTTYNPKFIYVMPNFQNPTGYSYSYEKKLELLTTARNHSTYIVEDDFLSELSFTQSNSLPLKSLDKHHVVIYIKSFSKIFMPGLRLGFMIVPANLQSRVLAAKHTSDISTSGLIQRTFDLYLRENIWIEHINFMKEKYKKRYDAFLVAVKKSFPNNIHYTNPGGGLHMWFQLPLGYYDQELYAKCLKKGILITPGSLFYNDSIDKNHFRMSFAAVHSNEIESGVKMVGDILHEYLGEKTETAIQSQEYSPFM